MQPEMEKEDYNVNDMKQACVDTISKVKGKLSLRLEQPVVDSYVNAHAMFLSDLGKINDKDISITCRWYKSSTKRSCASEKCILNVHRDPGAMLANFECFICNNMGNSKELGCFCSSECFKLGWKSHVVLAHQLEKRSDLNKEKLSIGEKAALAFEVNGLPEEEWICIGEQKSYFVQEQDVGHLLKVDCAAMNEDGVLVAPMLHVLSNVVLPMPPMHLDRELVMNPRFRLGGTVYQNGKIRIVSYNILAEIYATRQMYPYCPMWAMNWQYRKRLLLQEMEQYDADVYCLQEAQADHYSSFLQPAMQQRGYQGIYTQKTRHHMGVEGKVDGCAIFFKQNKLSLVETQIIQFNAASKAFAEAEMETYLASKPFVTASEIARQKSKSIRRQQRLAKDNIAQFAILKLAGSNSKCICIANTHIVSNPEFPDVKLWQANHLLQQLEQYCLPRRLPLVLCGDFNSQPDSAVYQLISRNVVTSDHIEMSVDPSHVFTSSTLRHRMSLGSAYRTVFSSEPEYTNYTGHWKGVIDYVWYSTDHLAPFSVAKVHSPKILESYADTALPNCQFPSDHLALCVDFTYKY